MFPHASHVAAGGCAPPHWTGVPERLVMTHELTPLTPDRWFGLRFSDPAVERHYRAWRDKGAMSFARIGYLGSAPSWLMVLAAIVLLEPAEKGKGALLVATWIALLVALSALTFLSSARRSVLPLAALANCVAGFLAVVLLSRVLLRDEAPATRVGVMTSAVIVVMFFGFTIFRVPPGMAALAVTPYTAFGTSEVWRRWDSGDLDLVEAGSFAAAHWIAYLACLLVCTVAEIMWRRTFCKDQLITEQQQQLEQSRAAIQRYVPRKVAQHIVNGDVTGVQAPVRRRVTILFADLVGSTVLADRVEGEVVTQVLGDFMAAVGDAVEQEQGTITEFAGDGAMAVFGAPDTMEVGLQASSALRAAEAIHAQIRLLNEQWRRLGVHDPLSARIGINTGMVSVGSFGSTGRMTYTAIGLETTIAARLQSACSPGDVLLSESTWVLLQDSVPCFPRGEVACKGVHYPIRTYSPEAREAGAATLEIPAQAPTDVAAG
jgi:class 3 adenylate cyclase